MINFIIKELLIPILLGVLLGVANLRPFENWEWWAWFITVISIIFLRDTVILSEIKEQLEHKGRDW